MNWKCTNYDFTTPQHQLYRVCDQYDHNSHAKTPNCHAKKQGRNKLLKSGGEEELRNFGQNI